jgi:uncharacterized protein with PQ loop repeat
MEWNQLIGFLGTAVAAVAYLPQIIHLIKERCSAGISLKTYTLWIASSLLMLINAVSIKSAVFIVFQIANLVAISVILFYGKKYQGDRCPTHSYEKK